jgi:hypothetical protein
MKALLLLPAGISLFACAMPVRGEPERRTEISPAVPRGVTQYLVAPRRHVEQRIRQTVRANDAITRYEQGWMARREFDEIARRQQEWAYWQRHRQALAAERRSNFGFQGIPQQPVVGRDRTRDRWPGEVDRRTITTRTTTTSDSSTPSSIHYSQHAQHLAETNAVIEPSLNTSEHEADDTERQKPSASTASATSANSENPKPASSDSSASKRETNSREASKSRTARREMTGGTKKTRVASTDPENPMTTLDEIKQSDASTDDGSLPFGVPVPEKDGLVYSPFDNTGYVDVKGMPSGSKARCPYSKKVFRVP